MSQINIWEYRAGNNAILLSIEGVSASGGGVSLGGGGVC